MPAWTVTMKDIEAFLDNWGRFMRDFDPKVWYPDKASPFDYVKDAGDETDESREWLGWGTDKDGSGNLPEPYDYIDAGIMDNWLRKLRENQERQFDVLRLWYYHRARKNISESRLDEATRALLDIYDPHKVPERSMPARINWGLEDLEAA